MYEDILKELREWPRVCTEYDGSVDWLHDKAADTIADLLEEREALIHALTYEHNRAASYRWQRDHPWKSVSEKPKYHVNDSQYTGYFIIANGCVGVADYNGEFHVDGEYEPNVTHWMPIPRVTKGIMTYYESYHFTKSVEEMKQKMEDDIRDVALFGFDQNRIKTIKEIGEQVAKEKGWEL